MWTAVKIAAITGATLLILLFVALLVMVSRPALLVGVSGEDLAHSLRGGSGAPYCEKSGDGNWACELEADKAMTRYEVDVNWMGCWKARRIGGPVTEFTPASRDGCIELGDVIQLESYAD